MSTLSTTSGGNASAHAEESSLGDHSGNDEMSQAELGRVLIFGLVVGTPVMFTLIVGLCVAAGLGISNSLAVAVMPAVFSGVFFAGTVPLLRHCARHERAHEAALHALSVVPAPPVHGDELPPLAVVTP